MSRGRQAMRVARASTGVVAAVALLTSCGRDEARTSGAAAGDTVTALPPAGEEILTTGPDTMQVVPGSFHPGRSPVVTPPSTGGAQPGAVPPATAHPVAPISPPGAAQQPTPGAPTQPVAGESAAPGARAEGAARDTVRGRIAVVGAAPMTQTVIVGGGGAQTRLAGAPAEELARASGAEAWVEGRRDGDALVVARYAIRSVDGVPALDGVLMAQGDQLYIVPLAGRRVDLRDPPAALRSHVGARVWISGSPPGHIAAFGVLSDHHHH